MSYKSPMGDEKKMNSIENLPTELPEKIKTQIEEIRLDNTSGSVKLATHSQLITYIKVVSKELVKAQSTMAPIFNLVNKALLNIYNLADEEEIRRIAHVFCQNFIKKLDTSGQMISKLAIDLITDNSTILTHSYSDTILKTLLFVTLIVDSAAASFLPETQLVLVGADALSTYGLINKIGTLGLALAAKKFKVDFHTLCDSEKILPAKYTINLKELKDPNEILSKTIDNVTPINYYFDLTSLEYLTGIITERGFMTPNDIKQYVKNMRIHRIFSD